jgi:hypothetical protein
LLDQRWLIEQANGVVMGREQVDAQAAFERLRGRLGPRPGGGPMWLGRDRRPAPARRPTQAGKGRVEQAIDNQAATEALQACPVQVRAAGADWTANDWNG